MDSDTAILLDHIKSAISSVSVNEIGVAFSGGVDSSLMAKICHDMDYDIVLLTIGFPDSHDINFAKEINRFYKYPHKILEITNNSFQQVFPKIKGHIQTDNLSWNENSIAFYYVSKLAKSVGITTVVTANGIDELFCGYNAYREVYDEGKNQIMDLMEKKLSPNLRFGLQSRECRTPGSGQPEYHRC